MSLRRIELEAHPRYRIPSFTKWSQCLHYDSAWHLQDRCPERVADINVDADGAVKGTVRIMMTGPDAHYWRQLTLENDVEEVKKRVQRVYSQDDVPDGVRVDFDHFISLDEYTANLMAVVKITGNMGSCHWQTLHFARHLLSNLTPNTPSSRKTSE